MNVHVSRDGQQYGPYSLEELKGHVGQGAILPADAAWSGGMSDRMTVADVLARAGSPLPPPLPPAAAAPAFGPVGAALPSVSAWPDPPDMNWALVLVLSLITCGIFGVVWTIKQALYAKKLDPASQGLMFYIGWVACAFGALALQWATGAFFLPRLLNLAGVALLILGAFNIRTSFQRHFTTNEPVGLKLDPVMTFFFSSLYFQYHLSRIASWRRTGVLA